MPIRQMPNGTYHAWTVFEDSNGQEVSFSGFGDSRGDALNAREASVATGLKAFPGLKAPERQVPTDHVKEAWDYQEPQKDPVPCITVIEFADGRTTRREMDWSDRDAFRRFKRAAGKALELGGRVVVTSDLVAVEGLV